MTEFGKRVKELREEKGLTQRALAEAFGLTHTAIYEWEVRGKETDYQTLWRLADFFGVTIDYLIAEKNSSGRCQVHFQL